MKKNILSENMARFGTKNLTESAKRRIEFENALNTIRQMGLQEAAIHRLITEQESQGGSTPPKITLNYDNGMFRMKELAGRGNRGFYYLPTATFIGGGTAGLKLSAITFTPAEMAESEMTKSYTVKLAQPFSIMTPIDYKKGASSFSGLQLNTNDPGLKAMMQSIANRKQVNADMITKSMNGGLATSVFTALANVCADNGWYTGPNKDVATMYAIFINHPGDFDYN